MIAGLIIGFFSVIGLLLLCPLYVYIGYDGEFVIQVRFLFLKFGILPSDKKTGFKKKKKKKKNVSQKVKTDSDTFLKQVKDIKNMIVPVKEHILKAFTIRRFKTDIIVSCNDPCDTALLFGAVNAAAFSAFSALDALFCASDRQINISADYNEEKTVVFVDIVLRTFLFKLLTGLILLTIDDTINLKK